ncbi:uncharacterized protein LOC142776388 isoform X2 [Rhipicephalus microplus]|uniref:uncharacterized protein LOC142776388 isoform X2 n=1 Tax=Rhipicephalus microplus TaxID=6941 RepID=UPI003F6AB769
MFPSWARAMKQAKTSMKRRTGDVLTIYTRGSQPAQMMRNTDIKAGPLLGATIFADELNNVRRTGETIHLNCACFSVGRYVSPWNLPGDCLPMNKIRDPFHFRHILTLTILTIPPRNTLFGRLSRLQDTLGYSITKRTCKVVYSCINVKAARIRASYGTAQPGPTHP